MKKLSLDQMAEVKGGEGPCDFLRFAAGAITATFGPSPASAGFYVAAAGCYLFGWGSGGSGGSPDDFPLEKEAPINYE